ncbi:MAG: 4-hydroxy-tetrahydrodipicolinate synthase [Bacteroidetes bacterium]|nr:4-hydroxy-tetrahydrodipicolinate synthase [Bacteroidota bacterium]
MYEPLNGTGVALITPFSKDLTVDYDALTRMVNHLIKGKVEYIVILGTTGENVTLSNDEKHEIINHIIAVNKSRIKLVLGVGGNNSGLVAHQLSQIAYKNLSAILSVAPYYNKPNQTGLYQHYKLISESSPLPVILYNVPGRTGVSISAETQLALAYDFKNIVATKEASGNMDLIMKIIKDKPKKFGVISGDDNLTLPMMSAGAQGVISVSANAFPQLMSNLVQSALSGDYNHARALHYKLFDITNLMFEEGSPAGVKFILKQKKLIDDNVRLPLVKSSATLQKKINISLKELK